jgi:hypothetical protein
MAIRLGPSTTPLVSRLQLPDGLRWEDEFSWTAVTQQTAYTLTGALVVEQGTRQAGRPLTLAGGRRFAWMGRADVATVQALFDSPPDDIRLTLHDDREFQVIPDGAGGALEVEPLPVVSAGGQESGYADPPDTAKYVVNRIKFLIVDEIV